MRIRLELRVEGCEGKLYRKLILSLFNFVCRAEMYSSLTSQVLFL